MKEVRFKEENLEILHTKSINSPWLYGAALYISNSFDNLMESKNWKYRLKIVVLNRGTLTITRRDRVFTYTSKAVILLSASEKICVTHSKSAHYIVILFHPNVISKEILIKHLEGEATLGYCRESFLVAPFYYEKIADRSINIDNIFCSYLNSLVTELETLITYQKTYTWLSEKTAIMYQLLYKIEQQFRKGREMRENQSDLINEICNHMQNIQNEQVSLQDICHKFSLNRTTLNSLFKEATNKTVIEYLLHLRLERAQELLTTTDMNISEISNQTGFTDPSYFSRSFKSKLGYSPTHFRKTKIQC